jgi:serine protease inhibitor
MRTLFASLNQSRDLFPANELFVTSETTLDAAFVASVAPIGCRVSNVDFKKAKDARKAVNTAVNKATDGRVGRLLRDPLDASNSWAAVQAMAAAPEWRTAFALEPKKRDFLNHVSYVLPPMPTSVPFLRTSGAFRARNDSSLSALTLELPLKTNNNTALSLHVVSNRRPNDVINNTLSLSLSQIMPSTPLALQNLNENLTFADIQTAFEKTAQSVARPLVVVLPKLKLESG